MYMYVIIIVGDVKETALERRHCLESRCSTCPLTLFSSSTFNSDSSSKTASNTGLLDCAISPLTSSSGDCSSLVTAEK